MVKAILKRRVSRACLNEGSVLKGDIMPPGASVNLDV